MRLATEILHEVKKKATFWKVSTFVILAVALVELVVIVFQKVGVFMKRDIPTPNAPVFANLRNRGLTCIGVAETQAGLERARSQGLRIFEPRLNYSVTEYSEICERRKRQFK